MEDIKIGLQKLVKGGYVARIDQTIKFFTEISPLLFSEKQKAGKCIFHEWNLPFPLMGIPIFFL